MLDRDQAIARAIKDLQENEIPVELDVPMAKKTTYGIGGPVDAIAKPRSEDELMEVLAIVQRVSAPFFCLGGGSNILVGDRGIRGVAIQLYGALREIAILDDGNAIEVGAGATFPKLTRTALDLGWRPALGWMGTPGQVGGALKMNAGTRDGEIGDVVIEVRGVNAQNKFNFSREESGFRYRGSNFLDGVLLTSAFLRCDSHRTEDIGELDRMAKDLLKKRHATQPKARSAGSLFKNPEGDYAGRLIESVGLKGVSRGAAQISDIHANFFVNLGGASAADVLALGSLAQQKVKEKFGVELEWEVKRVGEFS